MEKKSKMTEHGFSLVELLVVISILGILVVIALPRLSDLKTSNQVTKYKKYAESLLTSGKLYTDSNASDMFGYNTSGCYDIPYQELKDANLAKPIKIDGSDCSGGANKDTFVRVMKSGDHYTYEVSILCVSKSGQELYKSILNKDSCDGSTMDSKEPTITINPNSKDWTTGKGEQVTVTVSDAYGMLENSKVKYAWTKGLESIPESSFKTYDFKNKRYEGTISNPLKMYVSLPQNVTGIYYLVVKPVDARDINGNYLTSTVQSGQFKIDNTKPVITSTTNSKNGVWTNENVTITAAGEDKDSGIKAIYYYYDTNKSYKTDWVSNNITNVSGLWTAERDNEVFIVAEDKVGNKSDPVSAGRVKIDKTKPKISSIANSSNGAWTNTNVTIKANVTDNLSGVKTTYYYYDTDKTLRSDWNTNNAANVLGTWSAERNNEVFLVTIDHAGNKSDPVSAGRVRIDKTKPTISSITNPSNGNAHLPGLKLTLNGYDNTNGSGINKWRYTYNLSSAWIDYASSNYSPYITPAYNSKMNKTVYISLCDNAGNCSAESHTTVNIVNACDSTTTTWSGTWSACTKTCGGGTQTMTGTKKSIYDGSVCGYDSKTQSCNTQSCEEPINATRYSGCDSYYITTCTSTICKYSKKNGSAESGTIERSKLSTSPSSSCNQTYCYAYINSANGNIVTFHVTDIDRCKIISHGAEDKCRLSGGVYNNYWFNVDFGDVDVGESCGIWIEAKGGAYMEDGVLYNGVSWRTRKERYGKFCTGSTCVHN